MHQVSSDLFEGVLWSPKTCQDIIDQAELHGNFSPMAPGDRFRTQDVVLSDDETTNPMLARLYYSLLSSIVGLEPFIRSEWCLNDTNLANQLYYHVFIVKYTIGIQESLRLHYDESEVTISVKLNDSYTGCELWFPRQKFENSLISVGNALIFPGGITHPHEARTLRSGTKYVLNAWAQLD